MTKAVSLIFATLLVGACNGNSGQPGDGRSERDGARVEAAPTRAPDVIFVPTVMPVVQLMLDFAAVDSSDLVYDLGSGDGRIVITAASQRGARGVGIDIDPKRIAESRANADSAGVTDRVEFRNTDLFKTDLRSATAVTLYLLPSLNVKLRPKLFAELKPGTPVVSHAFEMGDWEPDTLARVGGKSVYLWRIPANVSGTWRLATGEGGDATNELKLEQRYQKGYGTLRLDGRSLKVTGLRVNGAGVRFTVDDGATTQIFEGEVRGDTLTGTARGGAAPVTWRATRVGPPAKISE